MKRAYRGVLALLLAACAVRRDDGTAEEQSAQTSSGSVRLLDAPDRIEIRSDWNPDALAADPTKGLEPILAADFEKGIPGETVKLGTITARSAAEAAASGRLGARFEGVTGALCFALAAKPGSPYLVEVRARASTREPTDSKKPAGQLGQLLVLELQKFSSADAEALVARLVGRSEPVLAAHSANAAEDSFAPARLVFKTMERTRALLVVLLSGSAESILAPPAQPEVADPGSVGFVDFDDLELFALPLSRHLALESDARLRDITVMRDRRRALLAPPGTRIEIPIELPTGRSRVSFSYAVLDDRFAGVTPIRFQASLETAGKSDELLSTELLPTATPRSRLWQDFSRDLELHAGAAKLVLSTAAPAGCIDMAAFAEPKIEPLESKESGPPFDVVLISLDTLRADRLGCYGYRRPDGVPTSPRIDEFARTRCLRFANARSLAPWTLPSHATMFTGLAPPSHRVTEPGKRLVAGVHPLLPLEFARAGYATAAFTAGGFVGPEHGFSAGFDRYTFLDPCVADVLIEKQVGVRRADPKFNAEMRSRFGREGIEDWIARQSGRPFFLFVHTYVVHDYTSTRELEKKFGVDATRNALVPARNVFNLDRRLISERDAFPPEITALLRDLYDATIAAADLEVAALIEVLERQGRLDRTIVAIVSDHGEEHGEHGGLGHGRSLYEELLRVPFLLHVPGMKPAIIEEPVDLADLAPTLRAAAGLPPVEPCDGESVLERVRADRFAESFYSELTSWGRERALRVGRMKLLTRPPELKENALLSKLRPVSWELYDLDADPGERRNLLEPTTDSTSLAAREGLPPIWRSIARRFDQESAAWRARGQELVGDPSRIETSLDEEVRQRLALLGYAVGGGTDEE